MRIFRHNRYRAPITLVTFATFWASLMAPLSAAAQAADRAESAAEAARQIDLEVEEAPLASDSASEPREADLGAGKLQASDAVEDTEAQGVDAEDIKNAVPDPKAEPLDAASLPSGDDKSGVTSKSISVPKGSGTVKGMGESFSAQLSTGIATYSVPFALPSARGGVQPSLGLSYSSSGGHGSAGVGWNVGSAFIARQTDRGLPSYDDRETWHPNQDRFVFNGGQELVPICDIGDDLSCAGSLPAEQMPAWGAGWQYHRARVEGGFMRFFWSPDRLTWRVQSKSGQVLELGVPLDGSNYGGAVESNASHPQEIYRWYVSREYDTYTDTGASDGAPLNVVHYRYLEDGGSKYLADIYDTTPVDEPTTRDFSRFAHHTHLTWEVREDKSHSYRSGWRMEQNLRLGRVDVSSASEGAEERGLVRRYVLQYDPQYHVSLLESVQVFGRCAETKLEGADGQLPADLACQGEGLPPMTFGYSHVGAPTNDGWEPFAAEVRSLTHSPPHSLDEAQTDLFDVNSDGLPDVLVTAPGYYGGGYGWFENGGNGALEDFSDVQKIALKGVLGANASTLKLSNLNLVPLDLDGDGHVNFLHMPKTKTYSVYDFVKVGDAYQLQGRVIDAAKGQSPKIDFGKDTLDTQVMDVNFDGLVDVVVTTGTQVQTFFSLGRLPGGDGQFGVGKFKTAATAELSVSPEARCVPHSGLPIRFSDSETRVADMNADGIPDIVRLQSGAVRYWPGRGNGFWGTGERDDCPKDTFAQHRHVLMADSPTTFGEGLRLDDVNGDGYPDLVNIRFNEIDVWLNVNGEGWTKRKIVEGTPPTPDFLNRVRLVDVDGSGTRDVLWGNGNKYQYIDLQGGTRPWILTEVNNGLGKTTNLEYTSSADEMLAARADGKPWDSTVPMVMHLVKRMTETDNLNVFGHGPRRYVTEYSYRDPVYDGRQREFRGFREATSTTFGDDNSPTSHARSEFLLGECAYEDGSACAVSDQSFDNPNEALKGLPVVSESYDDGGVYLSTSHTHYTLRKLYGGLDGRGVVYAFAQSNTAWAYDTSNPAAFSSPSQVTLETVTPEASTSGLGVSAPQLDLPVTVRATAGTVRTEGFSEVDDFGNALRGVSKGCVAGCPSGSTDDEIEQVTDPVLLPHDSGWLWRTASSYTTSRDFPARRGETSTSYTAEGAPDLVTAVLTGTEALQRFHESPGGVVAPTPGDAVADSPALFVSETEYDQFGNAIRSYAPGGRCADVFLDELYAQLATTEMMYPSGCPAARDLNNPPADALYTAASYDRGLELVNTVIDVSHQVTQVEYDGFGRLTKLFRSEPGSATVGSVPAVEIEYDLATPSRPYSVIYTRSQDGATTGDADYMESYGYVDGMGRALVGISEADPSANDEGDWIVGGFVDYDKKGAVSRKYLPKYWTGTPTAFPLEAAPGTPYGRVEYDAFGRELRLYDLDGTQTLLNVYHALSSDAWDAADDPQSGSPHVGTYVTSVSDGHGRGVLGIERFKENGSLIERRTETLFLPTGEPLSITRSSVHGSTTRWLRYDSLGRMVLNVEPHTSTNFNPDPFADATNIKAWRYLYNASGELVGTSDARGCGVNFAYDGVGRLQYEDYSPCKAGHQAYSPPSPDTASGFEVYYLYDQAPPPEVGVIEVPNGSGSTDVFTPLQGGDFLRGKLVAVFDRSKVSVTNYDGRSRAFESWVRLAAPGEPSDTMGDRFSGRWYRKQVAFDGADRVVSETTGAQSPELMGSDGQSRVDIDYSRRGTVKQVGGSYGALVTDIKRTADGLHEHIEYGDLARTRTQFAYDPRRRLSTVQTYRGPPAAWADPSSSYSHAGTGSDTFQKVLQDDHYSYDVVGNPLVIQDLRNPDEWPAGAKPVTRTMQYDDLYRVNRVEYGYRQGDESISKPEVTPAPFGVGPAGALTRATPRISAAHLNDIQRSTGQRPDLSQIQKASPPKVTTAQLEKPKAEAVQVEPPKPEPKPPGGAAAPQPPLREAALATQSSKLVTTKGLAKVAPQVGPSSSESKPTGLTFGKVITTAPTSYSGPTRPTYYWNRVGSATSYRIETIDSNGFQHEFVASASAAHCSSSGSNCWYYPPTGSGITNPYLPTGAARFRVVPSTSSLPTTLPSDWRFFGVGNANSPVAGELLLPAAITGPTPEAILTRGTNVSRLRLYIRNSSGTVIHDSSDYPAYDVCYDGRCGIDLPTLSSGNYTVWVQFQNEHGGGTSGAWSSGISFNVHPDVPSPLSPVGAVSNPPWATFRAVSGATEYRMEFSGPSGDVETIDWPSSVCSGGSTCGGPRPAVASGAWRWRVMALVNGTYRQPSSWVKFSYGYIPTVTTPTLSTPIGSVTAPVQFNWNQGSGTSRFSVEIRNSSGNLAVPTTTLPKSTFGCLIPGSYCTYYGPALPVGNYTWRVAALNEHDTTVWSNSQSFSVTGSVITQIEPQGSISTSRPTYRWTGPSDVSTYEIGIIDGSGRTFYQSYSPSALGCNADTLCELAPAFDISNNTSSRWWIKAHGGSIDGAFSGYATFSRGTPSSSVGDAANLQPTTIVGSPLQLTWTPGSNSSTHYVQVFNSAGTMVLNTVRQRDNTGCVGSGTTCTLPYASLPSGDYTFRIRARSETDYANWAGPVAFTIDKEGPSPLTPNTNFESPSPVFTFTARQYATEYQLLIVDAYGVYRYYTVTPAGAGCTDGGQCSYPIGLNLPNGASRWGVRATAGVTTSFKYQNFAVGSVLPVHAPTILTPSGLVGSPFMATWQGDPGSSSYEFEFTNTSGQVIESDELRAYDDLNCQPGTTQTCELSMNSLPGGNYTLRVRGYNTHGTVSPWSTSVAFTVDSNPPTPMEPSGSISGPMPVYSFTATATATSYRIWLSDMDGLHYRDFAPASLDCSTGTCFAHPGDLPVAPGAAQWGISALVSGSWTTTKWLEISYGSVAPLGTSTGLNPQGNVLSPVGFQWTADVGASKYAVRIFDSGGGTVATHPVDRVSAGCGAGTGTCTLDTSVVLAPGDYTWSVQTQSPQELGAWSAPLAFRVGELPSAPTVLAPIGNLKDTLPVYAWTAQPGVTGYELRVDGPSGTIINQTLSPSTTSCNGGTTDCSFTASAVLSPGGHTVWVRATNPFGSGDWSTPEQFNVVAPLVDQDDSWDDPNFDDANDPRRAEPSPYVEFDNRIRYQTWNYDWLGNTTETDDDAKGFYDRSLGDIQNGSLGGEAYQLKAASNRSSGSTRQGDLRASYDVTGNLTELRVDRDGTCSAGVGCSQIFRYEWDEVGRLVTARRWDAQSIDVNSVAEPVGDEAVELHYAYDASDMRVSKRAVDTNDIESHTLYIFGSLELRRTTWDVANQDYDLDAQTEVAYLFANGVRLARLAYEPQLGDVPSLSGEQLHVFFELGDHLGSTSVVLDKATSELVERSTYQAYGGTESDYRPERWKHFREDYRFTGKEEDVEVGLIYFGKRFLNPLLNRWVSADPLAVHGLGADPNLYAYVSGRVLQSVDPLGLEGMSDDEMNAEFDPDGESPRSQPNLHDTGEGGTWDPPKQAPDRTVVFNQEHILSRPKPIAQKRAERYEAAKDGTADGLMEFTETTLGGGPLMLGKKLELVPPRLIEGPAAPEDKDLAQHYDFAKKGAMAEAAGLTAVATPVALEAATSRLFGGYAASYADDLAAYSDDVARLALKTDVPAARGVVDPAKFRYLFGEAGGNAHNVARTAQNAGQMARVGVYNTAEGRALLQSHFESIVTNPSNITRSFTNQYGTFQVRESLFAGPGGFVKFESTWQVLEGGGFRFTTAIPFGGP